MKKTVFFIVASLLLFSACKKEDDLNVDLNVTYKESGNLVIKLVDNDDQPLANVNVELLQSSMSSSSLEEKKTNSSGEVTFEKYLSGSYTIYIEDVSIGGIDYSAYQSIQIISNETKSYTINPQSYSGNVTFNFSYNSTYVAGAKVIVFKSSDYSKLGYNPDITQVQSIGIASGTTDSNGQITFNNLPASTTLGYIIFNSTQKYTNSSSFMLDKGDEDVMSVNVFWTNI